MWHIFKPMVSRFMRDDGVGGVAVQEAVKEESWEDDPWLGLETRLWEGAPPFLVLNITATKCIAGGLIRHAHALGVTRLGLAQRCGISDGAICHWWFQEHRMSGAILGRVAKALGVTPQHLLHEGTVAPPEVLIPRKAAAKCLTVDETRQFQHALQYYCNTNHLSQREVARISGVGLTAINRVQRTSEKIHSALVRKLTPAMGTTLDDILSGKYPPQAPVQMELPPAKPCTKVLQVTKITKADYEEAVAACIDRMQGEGWTFKTLSATTNKCSFTKAGKPQFAFRATIVFERGA